MRIISGSKRGLKLDSLNGLHTRPTADRVKEALFSSLSEYLPSAVVLDACAGSGALGLEALSRGASHAVFCENNRAAFAVCRANIDKARLGASADVVLSDVCSYIASSSLTFNLVFLDPPYASGLYEPVLSLLPRVLAPGALVVVEFEASHTPAVPSGYTVVKQKRYGRVHLAYLMEDEHS